MPMVNEPATQMLHNQRQPLDGHPHVDFFSELSKMNAEFVITRKILDNLTPADYKRCSLVSKHWRQQASSHLRPTTDARKNKWKPNYLTSLWKEGTFEVTSIEVKRLPLASILDNDNVLSVYGPKHPKDKNFYVNVTSRGVLNEVQDEITLSDLDTATPTPHQRVTIQTSDLHVFIMAHSPYGANKNTAILKKSNGKYHKLSSTFTFGSDLSYCKHTMDHMEGLAKFYHQNLIAEHLSRTPSVIKRPGDTFFVAPLLKFSTKELALPGQNQTSYLYDKWHFPDNNKCQRQTSKTVIVNHSTYDVIALVPAFCHDGRDLELMVVQSSLDPPRFKIKCFHKNETVWTAAKSPVQIKACPQIVALNGRMVCFSWVDRVTGCFAVQVLDLESGRSLCTVQVARVFSAIRICQAEFCSSNKRLAVSGLRRNGQNEIIVIDIETQDIIFKASNVLEADEVLMSPTFVLTLSKLIFYATKKSSETKEDSVPSTHIAKMIDHW